MRNDRLDELQAGIKTGREITISDTCHSNGRKWRGTKEPFDEGEGGEWKSMFKTQYYKIANGNLLYDLGNSNPTW